MAEFEKLLPIDTPLCSIARLRVEGRVLVKQNDLTVAMGYNKWLSRSAKRGSGFGKYLKDNIVEKVRGTNYIDQQILVEGVLPDFLNHFYGLINGQPSRLKLFNGRVPEEIYNQTKTVYEILKGELEMCYDENSLEAKKGKVGERVVHNQIEYEGYEAQAHPFPFPSGASTVDFAALKDSLIKFFAEAKVQRAFPFGAEYALCYSFPIDKIMDYVAFSKEHNAPVYLYVVDPIAGKTYYEDITKLLTSQTFGRLDFPHTFNSDKLGNCYRFHQKQFSKNFPIQNDDLFELCNLFELKQESLKLEKPKEIAKPEIPFETMNPHHLVRANGKYCRTYLCRQGALWIVAIDYNQSLGLSDKFNLDSGQGRYAVEHSLIKRAPITALNFEGVIKDILPSVINGVIPVMHKVREAAKIVLEDLTAEYQRLTADKEPKEMTTPKQIQIFKPEDAKKIIDTEPTEIITTSNDKKAVFNQFINVFNVDKEELFQLVDKAQEDKHKSEQERLQSRFDKERAQLKELLK